MPGETQRMAMPRIESTSRRDQVDEDLEETRIDAASSTFISMALQNLSYVRCGTFPMR
jgi:hypothetical protein